MVGPCSADRDQGLELTDWVPSSGPRALAEAGWLHVWHVDVPAFPQTILDACVTDEDQQRAAVFHREDDKRRSIAARAALRHLCAGYLGTEPRALVFGAGEDGKPRLEGPLRASGLTFNLSHSGRHLLLAFARGAEVGVDVEALAPIPDLGPLIAGVACSAEAASLNAEPDDAARLQRFLALWTAKEAVLKAIGTGLGSDPKTARFSAKGAEWIFQGVDGRLEGEHVTLRRAGLLRDAVAHVALIGRSREPHLFCLTE